MAASIQATSSAMVLGVLSAADAPPRVMENLECMGQSGKRSAGGYDPCSVSAHPIEPLLCHHARSAMRWFDFDPEGGKVHKALARVKPVNLLATVKYFRPDEGGVSLQLPSRTILALFRPGCTFG
jgi:hypothetical protein